MGSLEVCGKKLTTDEKEESGSDRGVDSKQALPVYKWSKITEPFITACKDLSLGELIHDENFGLFEAMSAIEMMDPKMDAGMRKRDKPGQDTKADGGGTRGVPLTFDTAVACGHLPMGEEGAVPTSDLLGIIDQTVACLVTWLEGHSLAQTVFTNLYLHAPFKVSHPLLKAFSVVTLKLVDLVKEFVTKGSVYEEEDFQPMTYGFNLASAEVSETRAAGMLREIEDDLNRQVRATKPAQGDDPSQEHREVCALAARVKFMRAFYTGFTALARIDVQEGSKYLTLAHEQLPSIVSTLHLGASPDPANPSPTANGKDMVGFESSANQRLLPPTFPRYTEIRDREASFSYVGDLINSLLHATQVVSHSHSFKQTLDFSHSFNLTSPCALTRSIMQCLYTPLNSSNSSSLASGLTSLSRGCGSSGSGGPPAPPPALQDQLSEDCKAFLAPPVLTMNKLPPYNANAIREYVTNFFNQCCRPMGMLVQTFGHNKARQRDKIPSLLEELAVVQEEADKLDTMLNAVAASGLSNSGGSGAVAQPGALANNANMLYLSTWLLYHVLRLMIRYILSGFELELFSLHEYPYMYWYLYELLYPWLTTCLHRAESCLSDYEAYMEAAQKNSGAKPGANKKKLNKGKSKKDKLPLQSGGPKGHPHAKETTFYQGYAAMCAGYFKLVVAMKEEGKIRVPGSQFDNEAVRYEHRFAPFNNLLTPPSMPYSQYMEVYNLTAKTEGNILYLSAARDFGRAKQFFDSYLAIPAPPHSSSSKQDRDEISTLITINKMNLVASSVLSKDATRKVEFDFKTHSTFPIVKFV